MTHAKSASAHANPAPDARRENQRALGLAFWLYKSLLSPVLHFFSPSQCLYLPTCSEYAYTAMSRFGIVRGSWMAVRRVARCHPWGKGGLDPVPERTAAGSRQTTLASSGSDQKGTDHLS